MGCVPARSIAVTAFLVAHPSRSNGSCDDDDNEIAALVSSVSPCPPLCGCLSGLREPERMAEAFRDATVPPPSLRNGKKDGGMMVVMMMMGMVG